ncbi:hypothetical protein QYE76_044288 [Lolium multiflorum]|uniref:F-box domain-containing protein n=1 Tax=Lolium multiflorum TaxID=4521 RepID=A0AAD8TIV2_LOLMU|nr:hypothetical protein QYE76_044288 [Lolium multiflorum]
MGHSRPRWKNAQRKSGQEDKGDAIPDELLGLVFLRLTSPLDLVRAAFACRSWRKVIAAEDFRVLSARHGAPSSIVAGHYHISFSHCHYRPSGLLPHFVPSSSSCWAGVAANNLALDFLPRAPNGDLSLELADSRGGLLLLADFDHTEHGKPFEQPSRLVVCDPLAGQYVTVPPPPAVSHTTFVSLFLGAALHGEDAAARISLSNYRVTCLIYHDGICKTCVFSPGPGGHAWTYSCSHWASKSRAPSLDGELLPPHGSNSVDEDGGGDGSGGDGEAFRGTSPSGRVPEQRLLSPDLGFAMAAEGFAYRGFLRRVFRSGPLNRRKGSLGGAPGCPHHQVARPGLGPRPGVVWGPPGPSLAPLR